MSTITELNPRLLILTEAARDLETLREHDLPAEQAEVDGDPTEAVRGLTARITAILQEG